MSAMREGPMNRREFLRAAGVAIGLPFFPSLHPGAAWADDVKPPPRPAFLCVPLGFVPNQELYDAHAYQAIGSRGWFPEAEGELTELPEVHSAFVPYREHISFLKGLSNHRYRGDAHRGDDTFLTCADTFADPAKSFSNTISCDQVAAASTAMGGADVRYRSLALGIRPGLGSRTGGLSWTDAGTPLSPMTSPARVFDLLFGKEDLPAAARMLRLRQKKSILDATLGQIRRLDGKLNAADRAKLDEVVTAVRGVEAEIQREERWIDIAKPTTAMPRPDEAIGMGSAQHAQRMFALIHAAFLTDSTRVVTYEMPPSFTEVTPLDKHVLNHTSDLDVARDSVRVDRAMSDQVAGFTKLLCDSREHDGQPLVAHALVAYGSGAWGANHCLRSLPCMLIGHGGGRIRQGMTRVYPGSTPIANLWLTMLRTCGVSEDDGARGQVELKAFADSTGTLDGLS
jgi:hypothetical protein